MKLTIDGTLFKAEIEALRTSLAKIEADTRAQVVQLEVERNTLRGRVTKLEAENKFLEKVRKGQALIIAETHTEHFAYQDLLIFRASIPWGALWAVLAEAEGDVIELEGYAVTKSQHVRAAAVRAYVEQVREFLVANQPEESK